MAAVHGAGRPEPGADGIQFTVPGWTVNEIPSTPWASRSRQIKVLRSRSTRIAAGSERPLFVFLSRRAARRSAPFDAAAAQSSHDDRQRLSPSLEAGSEKEATGIGAWRPESDRGAGLPGRAHLSEPAGGALSSRAAALVAGKDSRRLPFHLDN